MTMYAQITDGVITKTVSQLPRSTERVSNFYLLSEAERNAHGWYTVAVQPEPEYDPETQILKLQPVSLVEGVPTRSWIVEDKTVSDYKKELIQRGKSFAEMDIQEQYSVQEQLAALANLTTAGHRTAVVNKIQSVYGQFMTFRTAVNGASTLAELKAIRESYPALHGGN